MKTDLPTKREFQILCQVADGKLNKEIASDLEISLDTVKKHLKNIYRKINARNRIEAVHYFNQLRSTTTIQVPVIEQLQE
ncbi:MAG: helix-turn-helix transcriptional regulator [Sediminibacterium sp.]